MQDLQTLRLQTGMNRAFSAAELCVVAFPGAPLRCAAGMNDALGVNLIIVSQIHALGNRDFRQDSSNLHASQFSNAHSLLANPFPNPQLQKHRRSRPLRRQFNYRHSSPWGLKRGL
jgi:hypothetical protein